MKRKLLLIGLIAFSGRLSAQFVYTIKADSVKITNCDSAELILENHTQGVPGFLFNTGNGRTVFKRGAVKLNDSMYLIGADTLRVQPGSNALKWYKESPTPAGSNDYTVTGDRAVAIAGQQSTVYGINSMALGGLGSVVGGDNSFGIGDNSVVIGGWQDLDSCVDCVIVGGGKNVLHPSAVNSAIIGTGLSSIYPYNSIIASASYSTINGPSSGDGIGEAIIGGTADTVRGDGGAVFAGLSCNSYSFFETVMGLYPTVYTPGSTTGFVGTDRLFNIGNGISGSARSDAFTVLKNGNTKINGSVYLPSSDTSGRGSIYRNGDPFITSFSWDPGYPADNNVFVGRQSGNLANNSLGLNCGMGYQSLQHFTTGFNNDAYGVQALTALTTGFNNTGCGPYSLQKLTTGNENTVLGTAALWLATTTGQNTAIGTYAGASDTGSLNVFLGFRAGYAETGSNKLYISNSLTTTPLIYGEFDNSILKLNASVYVGGSTAPTAALQLRAGTATAGTAPLKLTSGTILSTPEDGSIEYDGTDLYFTQSATRYKMIRALSGSLTTDFGGASVSAFSYATATLTVTGAQAGDVVDVNANSGAVNPPSIVITAYVTSANSVTIRAYNASNSTVTMASDTYRVRVIK